MIETQQAVIEVRNLRVDFPGRRGTVTALSDVSLSIRPVKSSVWWVNRAPESL